MQNVVGTGRKVPQRGNCSTTKEAELGIGTQLGTKELTYTKAYAGHRTQRRKIQAAFGAQRG